MKGLLSGSGGTRGGRAGDLLELGAGIGIVLLVLFIGSFVRLRADLTSEKRYTLTDATREMVVGLDDVVYVRVYLHGALPADLRQLSQATRDLLDEMRVWNPEHIQYTFIDPSASEDERTRNEVYDDLQKQGLRYSSIRLRDKGAFTERIVFPGALVTYRDKTVPVQLLKTQLRTPDAEIVNRSINNLEYELASAFRQASTLHKPRIAFLEGNGELPELYVMDVTNALKETYEVDRVRINGKIDALSKPLEGGNYRVNSYDALVVAKPEKPFDGRDKYVIDQFVMNGGKVLWLVDGMNAHLDSLRKNQFSIATPMEHGLDDLLFAYGVRVNKDLVLDKSCAPIEIWTQPYGNQRKLERFPWYFEPVSIPESTHPIVSNIDPVHLRFASSLDTVAAEGIRKTVLLTSSPYSRIMRNPVRVSLNIVEMDLGLDRNATPYQPFAVLLEGAFTSAYADRLLVAPDTLRLWGYREQGKRTAQLVVGDGEVIANRVDHEKGMYYMLGYDRYANAKIYGNREFLVNAMNYLLDDHSLISIRSRAITLRQLDPERTVLERAYLQAFNTAAPVLVSVLAGLLFHYFRRRRYSQA
ncbi:MAG: gliding motility-associated ABC transporter substrate-binding protein GldG [Flavobacteriales bacterium]|nr:gliding motility-associated ABC transporter substrate-binding protein GldG [Flavobacteriales bacterium]